MKTTRILNCPFTVEELKEIGIKLALENQKKERLEDDKKQSQSQYKSEIDACDARIKSLAQKLARGSEERTIECDVLFNTPAEGKKTITRGDTGEVVQVLDMTESELTDLFINNLGARKEENEFVFRDKSRAKMCGRAEFEKLKKDCGDKVQEIFEKIGDGYTEEALVDDKPEKVELCLVVFELDNETRKDVFEVYRFAELPDQKEDRKEEVRPQLPAPIDAEAEEKTEVKRPVENVNPIHVGKLDVEDSPKVRFEVGKEYEIGGKIFECEHETEGKCFGCDIADTVCLDYSFECNGVVLKEVGCEDQKDDPDAAEMHKCEDCGMVPAAGFVWLPNKWLCKACNDKRNKSKLANLPPDDDLSGLKFRAYYHYKGVTNFKFILHGKASWGNPINLFGDYSDPNTESDALDFYHHLKSKGCIEA